MRRHTRRLIELLRRELKHPSLGCEVGVWRGHNAAALLAAFPHMELVLVDAYSADHQTAGHRDYDQAKFDAVRAEMEQRVEQFEHRAILWDTPSVEAAEMQDDELFDFVFLDASHDFDAVTDDIAAWWPKVRPTGILCGHDYAGKGDRDGVFGVKRAVDSAFGDRVRQAGGLVWWVQKEPALCS